MTSLLGPLPHASRPQNLPYEFSKPPASRTLLNLDCSADLTSYSRCLGPVESDRKSSINGETVHAHLEDRRDHILRSRESSRGPQVQVHPLGYPPSSHPHASVPNSNIIHGPSANIHGPTPRPHPAPFLLQRPLSTAPTPAPPRSTGPTPGNLNTYPPALQSALEQSSRVGAQTPYTNDTFVVTQSIDSTWMDNSTHTVGSYPNAHTANLKAAEYFVNEYGDSLDDGSKPQYSLDYDGLLRIEVHTNGSTGSLVTVYIQRILPGRR